MPIAFVPPRVLFAVRRYVLRAPEEAALPPFAGSTLRGAIGRALRNLVCATKMPVCEGCPVRSACVYAALHDGYTPPDVHSGTGAHAPPPLRGLKQVADEPRVVVAAGCSGCPDL